MTLEILPCEEVRKSIAWLVDDELEPEQALEIETHLADCSSCRLLFDNEMRFRSTLQRASSFIAAPASLRRYLNEEVEKEYRRERSFNRYWPAVAAAAILLAFIWRGFSGGGLQELDRAASFHAQNLPMDVMAADFGPVNKYLSNKLPFSIEVPKISVPPRRFGGRVTQFNNRDAAYLRYEMPRGIVSVFVYEDPGYRPSEFTPTYQVGKHRMILKRVRGYTTVRYRSHGLVYSIVTDLPPKDLPTIFPVAGRVNP